MPQRETPKCECGYSIGLIIDGDAYKCGACLIAERDRYKAALDEWHAAAERLKADYPHAALVFGLAVLKTKDSQ